jgi:tetratricopeptide (TPR) repeat protein
MPFGFPRQSRSVALLHMKRYDAALDADEDTLTRHPEFAEEWARKARALGFLGKNKEAATAFKQARSLETSIGDWDTEFRVLTALKRYDDELASTQRVLVFNRGAESAWNNLGMAVHNLRRDEEALANFDWALTID